MVGSIINGYKISEYKGQGSFGTVYKCEKDNRTYAMKIFSLQYVFNEYQTNETHNRITQEIEALRRINHFNVVKIFDSGTFLQLEQKYQFIIMEYVEGENLKDLLIIRKSIPLEECIALSEKILDGLQAIHSQNIVHRDLKPENIIVTNDKQVKILDFGLSKIIDFSSITSTGFQIGSPLYMSPEQVKDSKNIDFRSDYYSFGVILFELLTGKTPYGLFSSREELFYRIINEKPISVLQYNPTLPNNIDNLLYHLLDKSNFNRPNNITSIKDYFTVLNFSSGVEKKYLDSKFFLRLYNDKTALLNYYKDGYIVDFCVFPINLQTCQKKTLPLLQEKNIPFLIDPATMRLAYDTYADVNGLVELPYAPQGYNKLEVNDFLSLSQKQKYVELVIKEQLKYDPFAIVTPFHISNNSNLVSIKNDIKENWFSLDVKLCKEAKAYLNNQDIQKPLVGGFCIKTDILTSKEEQEYFLNVLTSLPCDYYLIYVDCINYTSNSTQIYHYIKTLYLLQKSTGKPVIAGRVGSLGLILLAFGIFGFESGAARFESFSEDLYKEKTDNYNMFVMYYIPELLKNIPVKRKDPSKIYDVLENKSGKNLKCKCPYCVGKKPDEIVVNDEATKKHFLFRRSQEISELRKLPISDRLSLMLAKIESAQKYYQELRPAFKPDDYAFLNVWERVINDLRSELKI